MKRVLIWAISVALISAAGTAAAAGCPPCGGKVWDDLSWWCQSGATPEPVKDAVRAGYWWWPTEPKSNADDGELWGNRGVVYGTCGESTDRGPVVAPPPPPPPPKKERVKPVFNNVLFDFDKSTIKPEGAKVIDEVVGEMKKYGKDTVLIEGHTCNIGEEAYNMGLGQRRADAVKKYLVDNGVADSRVTTKSFGETQPAVPNDTPANRKLNRRAVFVITMGTQYEGQ